MYQYQYLYQPEDTISADLVLVIGAGFEILSFVNRMIDPNASALAGLCTSTGIAILAGTLDAVLRGASLRAKEPGLAYAGTSMLTLFKGGEKLKSLCHIPAVNNLPSCLKDYHLFSNSLRAGAESVVKKTTNLASSIVSSVNNKSQPIKK